MAFNLPFGMQPSQPQPGAPGSGPSNGGGVAQMFGLPASPQGAQPGQPGSYNTGPDANGYGGAGEIVGGNEVNYHNINDPYFQQDRGQLQGLLQGQSPFAQGSNWDNLISQLQQRASGQGPSLAAQQYQSAQQDTANNLAGMAHGGASPAAFRQAAIQQGRVGQGMAAGVAQARTQEQTAAQQQLGSVLGTQGQINSNAYQNILGQQLGLSAEQLKALQGDQNASLGFTQAQNQANAAQMQAIAGLLGGAAKGMS